MSAPADDALARIIRPRLAAGFLTMIEPTAETYGLERAEELIRDLRQLGHSAMANSMSFIAAPDDETHEAAGAAHMSAVERALPQLIADPHQGASRAEIAPGLREARLEHTRVFFIADDTRRAVRIILMVPS